MGILLLTATCIVAVCLLYYGIRHRRSIKKKILLPLIVLLVVFAGVFTWYMLPVRLEMPRQATIQLTQTDAFVEAGFLAEGTNSVNITDPDVVRQITDILSSAKYQRTWTKDGGQFPYDVNSAAGNDLMEFFVIDEESNTCAWLLSFITSLERGACTSYTSFEKYQVAGAKNLQDQLWDILIKAFSEGKYIIA